MKWPRWIPYPICWIRAFIVLVINSVGWRVFITNGNAPLAILLLPIPLFGVVFLHHFLYGKGNKLMMPRVESWWEGLFGFMVMVSSFAVVGIFSILFMGNPQSLRDGHMVFLLLLYLFIAGWIYQMEYLIRSCPPLTIYKRGSLQHPASVSAFQDIEKDLERIKKAK
jgi:hypothetical protein